jgi:membrane protease YdiL (CAAX protease family)
MRIPVRLVLPLFLLIVCLLPMILGPLLDLVLAPWGIPFHRVMSRALLISALFALVLFRGHLRLRAWWSPGRMARMQIGFGLTVALVSGAVMIGLYFLFCGFYWAHLSPAQASLSILTATVAALIVPLLEETIFRGFLVTLLVETAGRRFGWVLAALIYTCAHFLRGPPETTAAPIHFWSGATSIVSILAHLGNGDFLSGRGLNLFLVGLILGGVFLRTGTLWVNAGIHGGWILILMIFTAFTRPVDPAHFPWLGTDILSSPLTSAVLLALGLGLKLFYRVRRLPHR